jgi:hypothetical protein
MRLINGEHRSANSDKSRELERLKVFLLGIAPNEEQMATSLYLVLGCSGRDLRPRQGTNK